MTPKTSSRGVRSSLSWLQLLVIGLVLVTISLITSVSGVSAQNPPLHLLNYTGRLKDASDLPIPAAAIDLTFAIYDGPNALTATQLWTESYSGVIVKKGYFNVKLGSQTAFPASMDFSQQYYLGIAVNTDPEMTPLVPFTPAPYAFYAFRTDHANSADTASHAATADYAVNAGYATNSGYATESGHAATSSTSHWADFADQANHSLTSDRAATASTSHTADYALNIPGLTPLRLVGTDINGQIITQELLQFVTSQTPALIISNDGAGGILLDFDFSKFPSDPAYATLAAQVRQNTHDISTNSAQIQNNLTSILQNQFDIATNSGAISAVQTDLTQIKFDIGSNSAQIQTNLNHIKSNQTDIATIAAQLNTLGALDLTQLIINDATIAASLQTLNSLVTIHTVDIATIAARLETMSQDIDVNAFDIATLAAQVAQNIIRLDNHDLRISQNAFDIATLSAQVAADRLDITALQSQVALNMTNIISNTSAIAALQWQLNHLPGLTLPQDLFATSSPTFQDLTLNGNLRLNTSGVLWVDSTGAVNGYGGISNLSDVDLTSLSANGILVFDGMSWKALPAGTANQALMIDAAGQVTWQNLPGAGSLANGTIDRTVLVWNDAAGRWEENAAGTIALPGLSPFTLVGTDGNSQLVNMTIGAFIETSNTLTMTEDPSTGKVTLSLPQDLAATSSVTFDDLTITDQVNFTGRQGVLWSLGGVLQDQAKLDNLSNIDVSTLANGYILRYDAMSTKWTAWQPGYLNAVDINTLAPIVFNPTTQTFSLNYNPTNLQINSSQQLDTIQDISPTSQVTFDQISLTNNNALLFTPPSATVSTALQFTNPTQNNIVVIPDASGTVVLDTQKGVAYGIASLDANGKIVSSQLPSLMITDTFVVGDLPSMLALPADIGDIAVRTDENKTYVLQAEPASIQSNWIELLNPGAVASVNGQTGVVTLTTDQISEGSLNKYYTDTRARLALSAQPPLFYNSVTGQFSLLYDHRNFKLVGGVLTTIQDIDATASPTFAGLDITGSATISGQLNLEGLLIDNYGFAGQAGEVLSIFNDSGTLKLKWTMAGGSTTMAILNNGAATPSRAALNITGNAYTLTDDPIANQTILDISEQGNIGSISADVSNIMDGQVMVYDAVQGKFVPMYTAINFPANDAIVYQQNFKITTAPQTHSLLLTSDLEQKRPTVEVLKKISSLSQSQIVNSFTAANISKYQADPYLNFGSANVTIITQKDFAYTGAYEGVTVPAGNYRLETWGAAGGALPSAQYPGGKGGYSSGEINFTAPQTLYAYVGEWGYNGTVVRGYVFNGGGGGYSSGYERYAGGGATDFRLTSGTWNDLNSLRSRIMVAGGAPGGQYTAGSPQGAGGAA